ncbi:DUF3793 family protein [Geoalkalibacter sp.]|jgi:hypothetical protein|uniref:DUF3793 family protein n=1 Tax=Geoalkalibacter sp. TaxID=3041440 RepID=UPI00272E3743|nr:DUF3793 family protein [Geoalkalibacter sp.]
MPHHRNKRPIWNEFAARFRDEKDCLASFLALETAEILEGAKPANLLNLVNRERPCGRNLYKLWQRHGAELLRQSGLEYHVMAERGSSMLLFLYERAALEQTLARANVRALLSKAGHDAPADLQSTLETLHGRFLAGRIPHEIGALLGYPLKDVAGFMGWAALPASGQGPWKIYGAPEKSLRLAEAFLDCRCRMAHRLARCANPVECLKLARAA